MKGPIVRLRGARRALRRALAARSGGATVDFVMVFAPFVGIFVYVVHVGLSQFFLMSAADAAERAARLAATQPIAHCAALRDAEGGRTRALDTSAFATEPMRRDARACLNSPSPCAPMPGAWTCRVEPDGTVSPGCDARGMRALLAEATGAGVRLSGLEVTYSDSGFGHVGEPVSPLITVTLRQHDLNLGGLLYFGPSEQPAVETSVLGTSAGDIKWEATSC
ncbi:MAG TPA: hypothetical protein VJ994_11440 [Paracoccaceae bacterium]|nr:hypothetical protein [Paracoccaceae bacterium]